MVSVREVGQSLRGAAALVSRRPDALAAFDVSLQGLVGSVAAFVFTIPAFVVTLAMERRALGLSVEGWAVFDRFDLVLAVGLCHLLSLAALQLALLHALRGSPLASRYVPFAIATNWIAVFGSLAVSLPSALFLIGIEPHEMAALLTLAFGAIVLEAQWFATKVTLKVGSTVAAAVTLLGLSLQVVIYGLLRGLVG